jgi:hypothetical protein
MDGGSSEGSEARFAAYVEALGAVLGHADRQGDVPVDVELGGQALLTLSH